ncbi:hypothetical protein IV203_019811 [Nitzschia inconspicua]|uniref:DDE Tnp4 domain-containing protein n=1 Tax=Nitzschia inconspicua TaxID=303405 RepID=A0A9K3M1J1_9STRA|nr:hypothetical protein IV203_019811 [Nitzschia inconspicua]
MAKEKRLFPGIGAKCTILTRFMKPNGGLSKEKDHRSIVVLKEFFYEGHRLCFRFNLDGDDQQKIYHSNARYVRIDSEGGIDDFFFEADKKKRHDGDAIDKAEAIMSKKKEPAIKWKHSRARQLLYQDIMDNKVPLDPKDDLSLSLEDIFSMHAEYAEYDFGLFHGRLKSLRKTICAMNTRSEIDRRAYENYVSSHPVSLYSHGGYIQWQGSAAQKLLQEDIKNELHDLQRTRVPAARVSSKANLKVRFFLMAMHFLKCYPTERQREATFQYCPSWSRRKIWFWINRIAALQSEKIFWPKDNFGNDIWVITVDGVRCWIQEPTHQEFSKDTSYFSHKYNHAGLCYELGISIGSNRLVWMNGPFPAGKSDLKIFKEDGLKVMLIAKKKMCIADGGYAGSDHIHHCSTPNIHDSRPVRRFKARALKRHEKFNGLIKNFHSVDCRFRHSIGKFKSVFEAICVICQYQIETDKPLYHVLVEDVLLEDEVE